MLRIFSVNANNSQVIEQQFPLESEIYGLTELNLHDLFELNLSSLIWSKRETSAKKARIEIKAKDKWIDLLLYLKKGL